MTSKFLNRRSFLRASGLGAAALAAVRVQTVFAGRGSAVGQEEEDPAAELISYNDLYGNPPLLGRVHGAAWLRIFTAPTPRASSVDRVYWGDVLPIYRGVHGEPYDSRARSVVWFETEGGYVHSAYVVPSHEVFHQPQQVGDGFWGEVTVPVSWQHYLPSLGSQRYDYDWYKCYYSQVHYVAESATDDEGRVWYRLVDDFEENRRAWVLAHHIRPIPRSEFAPISPGVVDKWIEIDLNGQLLSCYEGNQLVFQTQIASGTSYSNDEGEEFDFQTPFGDYSVQRKRPSRRMRGGHDIGLGYDVNGVPWCTYFSGTGAAIHGAYWHNNFGFPRSHGCINVTPDAAKWVYRWAPPYVGYDDSYRWTEEGELTTRIVIV
jgi:hypothetical protein